MCQASVDAFAEMWDFGLISSGAVMVPCPWSLEAAKYAQSHPGVDLGAHLTLTSEYDFYRWGPISTRDPQSGLMDAQGFFHKDSESVWQHADPSAALAELDAQVRWALREGIALTHIDTHMGSVAHPKLMQGYVQLATKYGLPAMIPRLSPEDLMARSDVDEESAQLLLGMIDVLEEMGIPLLDGLSGLELSDPHDRFGQAKKALQALQPGITHFIIHPSKDTPELRRITDSWECRVADFETFIRDETRALIKNEGIQIIGYKALKDLMPTFDSF
jgi:predicted glycoside hydrolase/deacetylase ChbG (UPF0249 family)